MQTNTKTLIQEARAVGVHVTEHMGQIQIHNIRGAGQSPVTGEITQQELLSKAIDLAKEKSFRNIHLRTSATYYSQEEASILAIWAKNLGHEFKDTPNQTKRTRRNILCRRAKKALSYSLAHPTTTQGHQRIQSKPLSTIPP